MKKDIDKFIEELADYINRFIAGREGSHIEECMVEHTVLNRGHAIPIKCIVPGEDKSRTIGPCFYAEELLREFPHSSVAAIAEPANGRGVSEPRAYNEHAADDGIEENTGH